MKFIKSMTLALLVGFSSLSFSAPGYSSSSKTTCSSERKKPNALVRMINSTCNTLVGAGAVAGSFAAGITAYNLYKDHNSFGAKLNRGLSNFLGEEYDLASREEDMVRVGAVSGLSALSVVSFMAGMKLLANGIWYAD